MTRVHRSACYVLALPKVFSLFSPLSTFVLRPLFYILLVVLVVVTKAAHVANRSTAGSHATTSSTVTTAATASPCWRRAAQKQQSCEGHENLVLHVHAGPPLAEEFGFSQSNSF
jgi:hypothetical protein